VGTERSTPPTLDSSTGKAFSPIRRARATNIVALSLQSPYFVVSMSAGEGGWYPPIPSESDTYRKSCATQRAAARSESSWVLAPASWSWNAASSAGVVEIGRAHV